jgi:putative MATE family efflux protein
MPEATSLALRTPSPDTRTIRSQVLQLAWPVMAETFLQTLTQIVSMALVGHLGATAVTSVGLSMQPLNMLYGVFQGAGVATTAIVARAIGAGNRDEAARAAAQAIMLSTLIALAAALVIFTNAEGIVVWMGAEPAVIKEGTRYLLIMTPGLFVMWISTVLTGALRGAGDTRTPMKVNIMISLISFAGNLVLVYGLLGFPAMGVFGAGLATTAARLAGGIVLFVPYLLGRATLPARFPSDFKWDASLMGRVLKIGVPGAGERLVMSVSMLFYARMVAGLGSVPYAAHTIGINAESISYMPGQAFAVASTTLVGQSLGAGRPDLADKSTYQALLMSCILVGSMGVAFLSFPEYLMRMYTTDPEVIRLGAVYLRMMAFCQIHQAFGFVFLGAIRGAGDARFVMWVTAFSAWALRLGITYLLIGVVKTGVVGAWWAMAVDGLFKGIAGWLWFRTGRWKRAVV